MKRKEIKKCGHNYYWSETLVGDEPVLWQIRKSFNNQILLNCSVGVNVKLLDKLCRTECTQYFYNFQVLSKFQSLKKRDLFLYRLCLRRVYRAFYIQSCNGYGFIFICFWRKHIDVVGIMCYRYINLLIMSNWFTFITKIIILRIRRFEIFKIHQVYQNERIFENFVMGINGLSIERIDY